MALFLINGITWHNSTLKSLHQKEGRSFKKGSLATRLERAASKRGGLLLYLLAGGGNWGGEAGAVNPIF